MFETEFSEYSLVLANCLKEVADELRSIELADLVSYIRFGSYTTLEDLVHSSTELLFRPGTLTFGWTAAVEIGWGDEPCVTLGMEFRCSRVSVFFDLSIRALDEDVSVCGVLFEEPIGDAAGPSALQRAIEEARLPVDRRERSGSDAPPRHAT